MSVCKYWKDRFTADDGMYACPKCDKKLKSKISKSEKNPDRVFVSCDAKYGGCGIFCFTDAEPEARFLGNAKPAGGSVFGGSYAAKPPADQLELATLKSKVATLESQITTIFNDIAALQGVPGAKRLSEDEHSDHSNEARKKHKQRSK